MKKNPSASSSSEMVPANTSVPSPTTSCNSQDGKLPRVSAPDAAPRSTLIDAEFWKNDGEEKVMTLLALFKSLLDHTYSPDVRSLAVGSAISLLSHHIGEEKAKAMVLQVLRQIPRSKSPMDCMF